MIRRIAVMTGDDDAPGMNAVIRAVTRMALHYGWETIGICDGFAGLLSGDFIPLTPGSMQGIIQRGGTMLGSIDSSRFSTETGQKLALHNLAEREIDALIVIGGGEAQAGAYGLSQLGFAVNGVAASVENDLVGSDITIGVDTALNIALDAIDHLKITKPAEGGAILVEVAGRTCGYLALVSAIASGAETAVIPEVETTPEQVEDAIRIYHERGIVHPVLLVAEGATCNVDRLVRHFAQGDPLNRKALPTRLAHIQRRAAPNAYDRLLGTFLGACAVDALARGEYGVVAGSAGGEMRTKPFAEVVGKTREISADLMRLASALVLESPMQADAQS